MLQDYSAVLFTCAAQLHYPPPSLAIVNRTLEVNEEC